MVEDLRAAQQLLRTSSADYAFPVTSFPFPIERAVNLDPQNRVSLRNPEFAQTRSQDLEPAFHDAGQFYWGTVEAWLNQRAIMGGNSVGLAIPRHRVQDIDTEEDWLRAESLMRTLRP